MVLSLNETVWSESAAFSFLYATSDLIEFIVNLNTIVFYRYNMEDQEELDTFQKRDFVENRLSHWISRDKSHLNILY